MEEHEKELLKKYSDEYDADAELNWACKFVKSDILTAFPRSRNQVSKLLSKSESNDKIEVLSKVWDATKSKGYINQNEANLLLNISRDWNLESQLIDMVKSA